jgi:hypothetical protein
VTGAHGLVQLVHQPLGHREIREALAQVDRAVFAGQLRHHGEDGGAHAGQLGLRQHGGGVRPVHEGPASVRNAPRPPANAPHLGARGDSTFG